MKIKFKVDIFELASLPFLMNGTKNRRYGLNQRHVLCQGLRFEVGEPRAQKVLFNVPQIKEHFGLKFCAYDDA